MLGVSLYNLNRLEEASLAFGISAALFNDSKSLSALGDSLLHSQTNITGAAEVSIVNEIRDSQVSILIMLIIYDQTRHTSVQGK